MYAGFIGSNVTRNSICIFEIIFCYLLFSHLLNSVSFFMPSVFRFLLRFSHLELVLFCVNLFFSSFFSVHSLVTRMESFSEREYRDFALI